MSTFINEIQATNNKAIIIPEGPQITYNELASFTGNFQLLFNNKESPLYSANYINKSNIIDSKFGSQFTIAISLINNLEFVTSFLSITNFGKIAAPLNPKYTESEFDFYFNDLNAKAVVVSKGVHNSKTSDLYKSCQKNNVLLIEIWWDDKERSIEYEVFNPNDDGPSLYSSQNHSKYIQNGCKFPGIAKPNDIALILHTSGTTGRPKTVPLTHLNITKSMKNICNTYKLNEFDTTYIVMPLFHVHGLIGSLLSTLKSQGISIIPERFSVSKFWKDFIKYKANWYSAVPTIHLILLNNINNNFPRILPKIRFIRSCSSALSSSTFHKLEKTMNAPVLEAYAMTEASHQMTSNNLPPGKRKPGTVGIGQGVEVVIMNEDKGEGEGEGKGKGEGELPPGKVGEVCIKGENVITGYFNNEEANLKNFTSNGYFRTGDEGYFDDDGFLKLTGRLKEIINRGGEKISPIEIDDLLLKFPKIKEVVTFGVDDEKYGQVVNVAIVPTNNNTHGGGQLTPNEVKDYLIDKVAKFKIPEKVYIVQSIPKTSTGKIQRRKIAEIFKSSSKL